MGVGNCAINLNRTYAKQPYLVGANGRSPLQMVYNWVLCVSPIKNTKDLVSLILVFDPRSEEPRYPLFHPYFPMNLNIVTLVGRAGGDPEVKYFETGSVVCNLTLAVNRRSRKTDQPDWFNLEIWGKTAEVAANYVRKGSLIGIKGVLKFEYWQDRNTGTQRSKPVIRVDELDLLGSKRDSDEGAPRNTYDEF